MIKIFLDTITIINFGLGNNQSPSILRLKNGLSHLGLVDINHSFSSEKHPSVSDFSSGGLHTFVKISNNEIFALEVITNYN